MTRARVPLSSLCWFGSLYALQGVVVAYFFNFNQGYLRAAEPPVGDAAIGWAQWAATLPLIFKFLAGPFSDRYNFFGFGHRKPYIILGLSVQTLGLLALTWIDPGRHLAGFIAVAVTAVAGLALYDTCCDGMVIDVTPPNDRQRVQGVLVGSRFLATMGSSWIFGRWLGATGTGPGRGDGVLLACAALALPPLVQAFWVAGPSDRHERDRFTWRAARVLLRRRSLVLLAFGGLYATVSYGVEINLSSYYESNGFGSGAIGRFAAVRYFGRALGGLALPLWAWRLGRPRSLVAGTIGLAVTSLGQAWIGSSLSAGAWGLLFGVANGWLDALFNVLCMEASDPRMAASTYALFMAISNVSTVGGGIFSSSVAGLGGDYGPVFLASGGLALGALAFVGPLSRGPSDRTGESPPGP